MALTLPRVMHSRYRSSCRRYRNVLGPSVCTGADEARLPCRMWPLKVSAASRLQGRGGAGRGGQGEAPRRPMRVRRAVHGALVRHGQRWYTGCDGSSGSSRSRRAGVWGARAKREAARAPLASRGAARAAPHAPHVIAEAPLNQDVPPQVQHEAGGACGEGHAPAWRAPRPRAAGGAPPPARGCAPPPATLPLSSSACWGLAWAAYGGGRSHARSRKKTAT